MTTPKKFPKLAARKPEEVRVRNAPCPLCEDVREYFVRDHCHYCGVVRGLVCGRCNTTLTAIEHPARPSMWTKETLLTQDAWRLRAVRHLRATCGCYEARLTGGLKDAPPKPVVRRRPRGV